LSNVICARNVTSTESPESSRSATVATTTVRALDECVFAIRSQANPQGECEMQTLRNFLPVLAAFGVLGACGAGPSDSTSTSPRGQLLVAFDAKESASETAAIERWEFYGNGEVLEILGRTNDDSSPRTFYVRFLPHAAGVEITTNSREDGTLISHRDGSTAGDASPALRKISRAMGADLDRYRQLHPDGFARLTKSWLGQGS
jgi:hypothetical protein